MGSRASSGTLAEKGESGERRPQGSPDRDIHQVQGSEDSGDKPGRMNIAETLGLDKVTYYTGEWNGHKFIFNAKPQLLSTPIVMQNLAEGINGMRPMGLADALEILIEEWDIDLNGEPFPPDSTNLAICPFDFLIYLADLITPEQEAEPIAEAVSG